MAYTRRSRSSSMSTQLNRPGEFDSASSSAVEPWTAARTRLPAFTAQSGSDARLLEGPDPHLANPGPHDVVQSEFYHRDGQQHRFDEMQNRAQTRAFPQVALTDVAVDDDLAVLADPGEEHLHFSRGRILGLVQEDEGVLPGSAAHHFEGDEFDLSVFEGDFKGRRADALLDGLDDRCGPGREFLLETAREIPEGPAARHVGARQDDLGDLALAVQIGSVGGGDPCLACSCGSKDHDLRTGPEGVEIISLSRVE